MNKPKFCMDCKHYRAAPHPNSPWSPGVNLKAECKHPDNLRRCMETGDQWLHLTPLGMRANQCGEVGRLFEANPPEPAPPEAAPIQAAYPSMREPLAGLKPPAGEIRKPGWGHPIMLLAYGVVALFVWLLGWAIFG